MIVRNNRIVLAAFLSLIMGFAAAVFTGCPSADDDDLRGQVCAILKPHASKSARVLCITVKRVSHAVDNRLNLK